MVKPHQLVEDVKHAPIKVVTRLTTYPTVRACPLPAHFDEAEVTRDGPDVTFGGRDRLPHALMRATKPSESGPCRDSPHRPLRQANRGPR